MSSAAQVEPRCKALRLPGYDYSLAGAYYVTTCTHDRQPLFGEISDGQVRLSDYGEVARGQWRQLPARVLLVGVIAVGLVTVLLPHSPLNHLLGMTPLPLPFVGLLAAIAVIYVAASEVTKYIFYRHARQPESRAQR